MEQEHLSAGLEQLLEANQAASDMCEAVEKAILALAKMGENPVQSEEVVMKAARKVSEICEEKVKHVTADLIKKIRRETRHSSTDELLQMLALHMLRAALNSSSESDFPEERNSRETEITKPIKRLEKLGEGGFGAVYKAEDGNGFKFALKEVPKHGTEEHCLRKEIQILRQLDHENIIKYYGCEKDEKCNRMFMELLQGSVKDEIEKRGQPIPETYAQQYTKSILRGLLYLHSKNIIHRDIKCANVLLGFTGTIKLADFGTSIQLEGNTLMHPFASIAGTLPWMAPEACDGESGSRSDVWSVGCTIFEMVKGAPPFVNENSLIHFFLRELIQDLRHAKLVEQDDDMSPMLQNFLLRIFVEMRMRPSVDQLMDHPWARE